MSDWRVKDAQMRANIHQKLMQTGEKDRLRDWIQSRLAESSWRDDVKAHCRVVVNQKGMENINVDDLMAEVLPRARELVPEELKDELLQKLRAFVSDNL